MADNQTYMQYFDWYLDNNGLWWRHCAAKAEAMRRIGISGVWLPPAYKGMSQADVGYGVYDAYDLGEFDQKGTVRTKYGTKEEYLNAVETLQRNGVRVFADIVMNQRLGADETEDIDVVEVAENDRNHVISGERTIRAWTRFLFPGRKGAYSKFTWDHTDFSGVDWDENEKRRGIFRIADKAWNTETDPENGNFDFLLGADVDTDNPTVIRETEKWLIWYVRETGVNGLRLDAVKHIGFDFCRSLLQHVREETGKTLPAVGEYWSGDIVRLEHYLDCANHEMALFDVPLHYHFFDASHGGGNYPMAQLLTDTLVQRQPAYAVTFVDNHDTEPGQSLQSFVDRWFKPLAYAVILLRRDGVPCVFYSDYFGLPPMKMDPCPNLPQMMAIRRDFAYGDQVDYFDNDNVVGWVRRGDEEHPGSGLAVVMSDGAGGVKHMEMGSRFAGAVFRDALNICTDAVTVGQDGWADFETSGGNVSVWLPEAAYDQINIEV